jgi:hypothetical protein
LSITRTTTRGEEHDFQSCTSRRSLEGLPGRHHRCRGLKAFRCDPGASFADSERKGGYFCFHVLASFSGAAHIARLLAKDADTARSLAGAAKEAAQDTAVSKSGAVGLAATGISSRGLLTDVVIVMGHAKAHGIYSRWWLSLNPRFQPTIPTHDSHVSHGFSRT